MDNDTMGNEERSTFVSIPANVKKRSPLKFFILVFALSFPFWLIGTASSLQMLPGLPVSSLMMFCPAIAASILVYKENKATGVAALLKRSLDCKRIRSKVWFIPTVLLMPGIAVLAYGAMRLLRLPLPTPQLPSLAALLIFPGSFIAALGEELGWSGYVIEPMQHRWNTFQASMQLGLVWAAWHIVPLVQADRSPTWIAWQCLNFVASRILLVWIYNNTGKSVFAAALCHATVNVSWQLFPNNGSHYDPRIIGLITALAAVIVIAVWEPRTLTRNRNI
jgi:membrane protease YdiL (CAAX protease family)